MLSEIEKLMQQGNWEGAMAAAQQAVSDLPVNPRAHAYLGMCYYRKNDFASASQCFRKAVTLDPNFWEAGVKLAQSLDRQLQYKEALQVAEHYLHQRPNDTTLRTLVNGLRRQQGAVEEESWEKNVKKGQWHNIKLAQD